MHFYFVGGAANRASTRSMADSSARLLRLAELERLKLKAECDATSVRHVFDLILLPYTLQARLAASGSRE